MERSTFTFSLAKQQLCTWQPSTQEQPSLHMPAPNDTTQAVQASADIYLESLGHLHALVNLVGSLA